MPAVKNASVETVAAFPRTRYLLLLLIPISFFLVRNLLFFSTSSFQFEHQFEVASFFSPDYFNQTTHYLELLPAVLSGKKSADIAVFYNLYVPFNTTESDLNETFMPVVREQIGQIASIIKNPVTVYYINIGQPLELRRVMDICSRYEHVTCKQRRYFKEGFEVLTLAELYEHCQDHEDGKVVYMHNKGSFHSQLQGGWSYVKQDVWRRMGTMAAASDMCLNPPDQTCDFCGLIATPLPWLHVPGNFWSSRCSYIQKLLHPQSYHNAMSQYRENIAEPYVNNNTMSMKFQIRGKRCFGDERFAAENWIGSHPSVIPCDVSNVSDIRHWQSVDRNISEFVFSLAPRRDLRFMMDKGAPRIPPFILDRESLRIRDYHLLGGLITRWRHFYKALPDNSSWVWSYYPDVGLWREGVEKYGDDVFRMVAAGLQ